MCFRRIMLQRWTILALLSVVGFTCPALAIMQPRLVDWQARLNRFLPREVRVMAIDVANTMPLSNGVAELQQALVTIPTSIPRPTLELFVGIRFLIRKDELGENLEQDLSLYNKSLELLKRYQRDCRRQYRIAPYRSLAASTSPAVLPVENDQPQPQDNEHSIFVIRLLPKPTPGTSRDVIHSYLLAAKEDQHCLEQAQQILHSKQQKILGNTRELRRHLHYLCSQLNPNTGLPKPQAMQGAELDSSAIRQIPAPPPFNIRTIKMPGSLETGTTTSTALPRPRN